MVEINVNEPYKPGCYRVEIKDHGIEDGDGEINFWLEFLPLNQVDLPGSVGSYCPDIYKRRCRQFFTFDEDSFADNHPRSASEVYSRLRKYCIDREYYGKPDPSDPHELKGYHLVAACSHVEKDGQIKEAWNILPVKRPPENQAIIDRYRKAEKRRPRYCRG